MPKYEVEWESNQGGRVSILGDEVEATDEIEAEEVAFADYYYMATRSVTQIGGDET